MTKHANYGIVYAQGTLTVNPKSVSIAGILAMGQFYDGTTADALDTAGERQKIYIHLDKIATAIQQAADRPEFEETGAVIDGLARTNKRDQSAEAVASRLVSFLTKGQSR